MSLDRVRYWTLMLTYPVWHQVVVSILIYAKRKHTISDHQMYEVLAMLDRTQSHNVLKPAAYRWLP